MPTLAQLSRQLDNALRAFTVELAKHSEKGDYQFSCTIAKTRYQDGPLISYSCGDYNDRAQGNDAGAVLAEYRRRKGWNEAHEPMVLIEGPKHDGSHPDDNIPF